MEEITHENESKKNPKQNPAENFQLLSEKNSNIINIQNIPNNNNNSNNGNNNTDKIISYSFEEMKYKKSKLFGINFYHIGNLYVFGFLSKNSEPLFCIDGGWYFQIIIYIVEILIFYFGNKYLYSNLEPWKQSTFNGLLIFFFVLYTVLILINPGIIIKNEKADDNHKDTMFCRKCKIYILMDKDTQHCYDCNVCVRKLDHHCTVVRRCITTKNFWMFIAMIVAFILIYIFSLINLVFYLVGKYKNMKHKNK